MALVGRWLRAEERYILFVGIHAAALWLLLFGCCSLAAALWLLLDAALWLLLDAAQLLPLETIECS